MGTTLTGTTPQDTYDSLIKVTDNGPLSGSLKVLTDGLGNNSTLSLSTTAASIAGTLAVTGNATFDTNTLFVDAAANRVGVGLTAPKNPLHVNTSLQVGFVDASNDAMVFSWGGASTNGTIQTFSSSVLALNPAGNNVGIGTSTPTSKLTSVKTITTSYGATGNAALNLSGAGSTNEANLINFGYDGGVQQPAYIGFLCTSGAGSTRGDLVFATRSGTTDAAPAERVRITDNGLTFNGDTAAANALDDYEEGTWTMGVSFGGLSVGVTTSANTGTYTKIGRQVTVNGYLTLSSKGSSTGNAAVTGLPFTIANTTGNYSAPSLWFVNLSFANQLVANGTINTTTISLQECTEAGVGGTITDAEFANNSQIIVSFTYFV